MDELEVMRLTVFLLGFTSITVCIAKGIKHLQNWKSTQKTSHLYNAIPMIAAGIYIFFIILFFTFNYMDRG